MSKTSVDFELEKYKALLQSLNVKVPEAKTNNAFDFVKFCIISFVLIFFGVIIIKNVYKTIRLYMKSKALEKVVEKISTPEDHNEYFNYSDSVNYSREIERNVSRLLDSQNNQLKQAKLELLASKNDEEMNPKKLDLEAAISLNVLGKEHDDYQYDKRKTHQKTFWDMLFISKDID